MTGSNMNEVTMAVQQEIAYATKRLGACPHCGSDHTQKASVIYEAGTTRSSGTSSFRFDQPSVSHSSVSQTDLAERASPPVQAPGPIALFFGWGVRAGVVGLIPAGLAAVGGAADAFIPILIACALLGGVIGIPFGVKNVVWNWTTRRSLLQEWRLKWYCHRCGSFFSAQE